MGSSTTLTILASVIGTLSEGLRTTIEPALEQIEESVAQFFGHGRHSDVWQAV